ncbi:DUF1848 domain-containing protein [Oleispirillum naphthae]|uniref:DUF1848 domain-containing protein n=1 Tax=Oleispirillum naphthae TaxID=2838853 RepID=UPI0030825176
MIVSASYRTDIPAFFSAWFAERWAAGFAEVENPYNRKPYRVSLKPEEVDGIVFWTRAARPFFGCLDRVAEDGVPFFVHYTVTGYGAELEPGVPDWRKGAETLHALADRFGKESVVWRYDPVLITETQTWDWHAEHFAELAAAIKGATDEAALSFAQFYAKTRRGLAGQAARDPDAAEKRTALATFRDIAAGHGLALSLCAQPELLIEGVRDAACIDAARLSRIAGRPIAAAAKPHRPTCRCAQSRDIGTFATCRFGCRYCYAA